MTQSLLTRVVLAALLGSTLPVFAQNDDKPKVTFGGFINHEVIYDSRQSTTAREGEVMLFPKPEAKDTEGNDVNDRSELTMLNFHTRLLASVAGPQIGSYKSSAYVEVDFLGTSDAAPNMIRMRHAFLKLANDKTEWLVGQYWHPMFVPECFPDIVGWNVALPVHVLSRNPQVRFTYKPSDKMKLTLAALGQRDFASHGPDGGSSVYLRRSGMPDVQGQLMLRATDVWTLGATAGYKTIVPRLQTAAGLQDNASLGSYNLNLFSSFRTDKLAWLVEGIYGQNLSHFLMLGGYAVKSEDASGRRKYTNLNTLSVWTDFGYNLDAKWRVGVFGGYVKNQGADEKSTLSAVTAYGVGTNIDHLISISPRVSYTIKNLKLAVEINRLTAAYGSINAETLKVENTKEVTNNRFVFSTTYKF
ncbi:MAG: hypothetical protein JXR39_09745 [Marinilabiliaceae bacterium]|nr:hypothetical protein [Marinilabiliaceae bacterium]